MVRAALLLSVLCISSIVLLAQERFPDELSPEKAVALALQYHPLMRSATAVLHSSAASLKQVQAAYFPVLNITATGARTDGAFVFNPSFPPRNQSYDNYSTGLILQQTLYDFGKTKNRISAGEELLEASDSDVRSARDNVVMNVLLAYINYVQAQKVVQVNEQTVSQTQEHLTQAKAFYSVGRRPQFDVTKAEVDHANANVNLIRVRNLLRVTKVQMENAIGLHSTSKYTVRDTLQFPPITITLDSAKAVAREFRPEVSAGEARVRASTALVSAAWSQHLPTVALGGAWNWNGFDLPLRSRWNAGITVSVPVFQGFGAEAQVEQAEANLDAAHASFDLLMESVMLDVEQNYLAMGEAEERISATAKVVAQAQENLKLAEARYNSGVGSAIEITDAQVSLSNARVANIQATADYNSSIIRLRRAMGVTAISY